MLVCINSISSLVRIQKICSFLNLILRKILRSFHIVYSYVHCCLLLISPKIIELRNFIYSHGATAGLRTSDSLVPGLLRKLLRKLLRAPPHRC